MINPKLSNRCNSLKKRPFFIAALLAAAPVNVNAQGTPSFRVPLDLDGQSSAGEAVYSWISHTSNCTSSCGSGQRTTDFLCQDITKFDASTGDYGNPEANSFCVAAAGAAPASSTSTCVNFAGCEFDWVRPPEKVTVHPIDGNPVGRPGCGLVQREFDPSCQRSDGISLAKGDHAFCKNDLPDYNAVAEGADGALGYDKQGIETNACNTSDHGWSSGAWGSWSSECSVSAIRTRAVSCTRRFDGSTQPDDSCVGTKPSTSEVSARYGSCTYQAVFGNWSSWSSTCSASATRTRTVSCERSVNGGTRVANSACTDRNIALTPTTETAPQYSGCGYTAGEAGSWSAWSSGCSASASRTRTRQCIRSDGVAVPTTECTSRGINLTEVEGGSNYGSCTYAAGSPGAWGPWANSCSGNTTRTRTRQCVRSDGSIVAAAECTNRGINLSENETGANYDGCSYSAVVTSSSCTAPGYQTRYYRCTRSDGVVVDGSNCGYPGGSETVATPACASYEWNLGTWSNWSACTTSGTRSRTRSVTCVGNGGAVVADANCTATKPDASEASACPTAACTKGGSWSWNGLNWDDFRNPNWSPEGGMNGRGPVSPFSATNQSRMGNNGHTIITGITISYTRNSRTGAMNGMESCPN